MASIGKAIPFGKDFAGVTVSFASSAFLPNAIGDVLVSGRHRNPLVITSFRPLEKEKA